ncbi:hydrogenase maturation nickel metallochaperone HypA [Entomohabitans teleogrylli]|uniref:hydrogenase maturation nickel metallochaperone HypA n=1 Tax=Entomohabitans teleogrylli TaxID=1384589 RepID=UPI00073D8245|nr:hydrogenase maturation nickel metallochaperone HypA [Entomohabitans teleogrylli]
MHELSLAQGVIQVLEEQAQTRHFQRVLQVWLDIGALACIDAQALQTGLAAASRNTLAERAHFHIRTVAAKGWCFHCSQAFVAQEHGMPCPLCGSWEIRTDGGSEMRIAEIEVE